MNFSQINGHQAIKNSLSQAIAGGRVSHAQMFTGNSSTGALPMAIAYARMVMCPNGASMGDACGVCPTCYKTERLEHPDLHFIYPVNKSKKARSTGRSDEKPTSDQFIHLWREFVISNGATFNEREWYEYIDIENSQGNINKDEAAELIRKMGFKSYEGGYKTVIIYLPERMNEAAANTLLKLIEEPAPKTLFLFVSESPESVIATIRSRVQRISLPSIGLNPMVNNEQFYDLFVELMRLCYTARYLELFEWADKIAPIGREDHKAFCVESIQILRTCYMQGIGLGSLETIPSQRRMFVEKFSIYVNHISIEPLLAAFELLLAHVRQNGNPRILFTHFALTVIKILGNVKSNSAAGK